MKKPFNPIADAPAETTTATATETQPEVPSTPSTDSTVAVRPGLAPAAPFVEGEDASGEFDNSDVEKLYLTIVAKTGKLSNEFTPGDLLLNKEFVIGGTKSPITVVPMGLRKLYQNDLDFESNDETGDIVSKQVDVLNRGGIVDYRPHNDKVSTHYWKKIANIPLLIELPADVSAEVEANFLYEIEGKLYAVVGYTARTKSAYNGIAKPVNQALKKFGIVRTKTYTLSVKGEDFDGKSWMQPNMRVSGNTSDAVQEFIRTFRF